MGETPSVTTSVLCVSSNEERKIIGSPRLFVCGEAHPGVSLHRRPPTLDN